MLVCVLSCTEAHLACRSCQMTHEIIVVVFEPGVMTALTMTVAAAAPAAAVSAAIVGCSVLGECGTGPDELTYATLSLTAIR